MTEAEFRFKHSELISYYQYIEMHLKGICSAAGADTGAQWVVDLQKFDTDTLWKLLKMLKEIPKENRLFDLSDSDFEQLDALRENRNYWCHNCFTGEDPIVFSAKGILKRPEFEEKIKNDLQEAMKWDKNLSNVFNQIGKDKNYAGTLI